MKNIITILGSDRYIAPLEKANEGQIAFTHSATVKWTDDNSYRFFVKLFPKNVTKGLINEITGYLIANSCKLPQPEKVAIIIVPKDILDAKSQSDFEIYKDNYILGWASIDSGPTPKAYLTIDNIIKFKESLSNLAEWKHFHEMLAFDDWVANQDRNLGNITMSSKGEFKLIDHGNVPVSENWTKEDLNSKKFYGNKMLEYYYPKNPPREVASRIVNSTYSHPDSLEEVIVDLENWYGQFLDANSKLELLKFLKDRAINGKSRMSSKTGLLVA